MTSTLKILGSLAAVLTIIAFLPQVVRVVRTRKTRDISLATFSIIALGAFIWIIYGIGRHDQAIMVSNITVFCLVTVIVIYKLKYK